MSELQRIVTIIPAKPRAELEVLKRRLRVGAYCRVSTEEEEQQSSYEAQCSYYTEKIMSNPDWILVDIFADEGITGTSTKKRDDFNRMIRMCKQGKLDLILTKAQIPLEVYHLTKRENVASIQFEKRIRRFGDTECWFCRSPEDMLRYMQYTVLCEGKPYIATGGRIEHYPKFVPENHVLLKLTPVKWEDKWYQWNQELPPNASQESKNQAAEFSRLKVGYRGDLRFSNLEIIELSQLMAEQTQCMIEQSM